MKSLKAIVKEFLSKAESAAEIKNQSTAETSTEATDNLSLLTKSQPNETDTDQNPRIHQLDSSNVEMHHGENPGDEISNGAEEYTAREPERDTEGEKSREGEPRTTRDGDRESGKSEESGESGVTKETIESRESRETVASRDIEEAYKRGVLDGRNARIKEEFFPNNDDGVPALNGAPAFCPQNDIFSLASQA